MAKHPAGYEIGFWPLKFIFMKKFSLIFVCFLVFSCNAPQAVYDYDQKINFNHYSTYGLFPDFHSGLSQLDERRLIEVLDNEMQKEGFSISENPDFYVNVYTQEYEEESRNNLGIGVGGTGRNMGIGISGGIPIGGNITFLRLTFDFIDAREDSLIWQAVVDSKFNKDAQPEQRRAQFEKIVRKALEGYPPEK